MRSLHFTVELKPEPQGDLKHVGGRFGKGRSRLVHSNKRLHPYRDLMTASCRHAMRDAGYDPNEPLFPKGTAVFMEILFFFVQPKTNKNCEMVQQPDVDKLMRACLDSLTKFAFADDCQVVSAMVSKHWGPTAGVSVSIKPY